MVRPASFESASKARMTGSHQQTTERTMDNVARVGIDLAKKVFHVTAVDGGGAILERRRLRRAGLQSYLARLPGAAWWRWRRAAAPPLGAACASPGSPGGADEPAVRGAVREVEQERRQRRGRDRGGVGAADDAVRAGEVGGAGARAAAAPRPADGGAQPHGAGQPDPRLPVGVRHRGAARQERPAAAAGGGAGGCGERAAGRGPGAAAGTGRGAGAPGRNGWRRSTRCWPAWRGSRRRAGG